MTVYINKEGYLQHPDLTDCDIAVTISDEEYEIVRYCPGDKLWKYENKKFVLVDHVTDEYLRAMRQTECFDIIDNRSQLWYSHLTDWQKEELDAWYSAWLAVTETKVIPEKPSWLK